MYALPVDEPDLGDLQPLAEAIEGLCAMLGSDREVVIEGLAEILRRRIAFEDLRRRTESRRDVKEGPQV